MKVKYLQNKDIDKIRWDDCIKQAKNSLIYAYSWYLDIVCENWDAIISEDYSVVMPLIWKKKHFIKYIYQPFFTQQSGIFYKNDIEANIITEIFSAYKKSFKYINSNFNYKNKFLSKNNYSERTNFVLNLFPEYEVLKKSFSKNHKRNIKKSYSNELYISNDLSVDKIIKFKKENLKTKLSEKNLNIFRSILEICSEKKALKIYAVYHGTDLIAVTVFTISKNRYYNLISASNKTGFEKKASFFLFNEFIKEYAGKNIILDFEGSNIPGIARFFKGWGAVNQPYYNFKQNKLPLPFRLFKK